MSSHLIVVNKKMPKLLLADLYNKLVDLLTNDFLPDIKKDIVAKLKRKDNDSFSFSYFKSSIKLIYLLKGFCFFFNIEVLNQKFSNKTQNRILKRVYCPL